MVKVIGIALSFKKLQFKKSAAISGLDVVKVGPRFADEFREVERGMLIRFILSSLDFHIEWEE